LFSTSVSEEQKEIDEKMRKSRKKENQWSYRKEIKKKKIEQTWDDTHDSTESEDCFVQRRKIEKRKIPRVVRSSCLLFADSSPYSKHDLLLS
jgi:hypothetical protein